MTAADDTYLVDPRDPGQVDLGELLPRPWYLPHKRDALMLLSVAFLVGFVVLLQYDSPGTLLLIGDVTGSRLQPIAVCLATWAGVTWVASRIWINGGPRSDAGRFIGHLAQILLFFVALLWSGAMPLFAGLAGPEVHEKFKVPESDDTFMLVIDNSYDTMRLWNGGPFVFHPTAIDIPSPASMADIRDHRFEVTRDGERVVLVYPAADGSAARVDLTIATSAR